jgi:hypothetical protein
VLECRSDGLDPVLHSPTLHHSNKKGVWQADCRSKIKHPLAICLNAKVSSQQFPNFKRLERLERLERVEWNSCGIRADTLQLLREWNEFRIARHRRETPTFPVRLCLLDTLPRARYKVPPNMTWTVERFAAE